MKDSLQKALGNLEKTLVVYLLAVVSVLVSSIQRSVGSDNDGFLAILTFDIDESSYSATLALFILVFETALLLQLRNIYEIFCEVEDRPKKEQAMVSDLLRFYPWVFFTFGKRVSEKIAFFLLVWFGFTLLVFAGVSHLWLAFMSDEFDLKKDLAICAANIAAFSLVLLIGYGWGIYKKWEKIRIKKRVFFLSVSFGLVLTLLAGLVYLNWGSMRCDMFIGIVDLVVSVVVLLIGWQIIEKWVAIRKKIDVRIKIKDDTPLLSEKTDSEQKQSQSLNTES